MRTTSGLGGELEPVLGPGGELEPVPEAGEERADSGGFGLEPGAPVPGGEVQAPRAASRRAATSAGRGRARIPGTLTGLRSFDPTRIAPLGRLPKGRKGCSHVGARP